MRVAAYQAPLLASGSMEAVDLIKERLDWCEVEGVEVLCCPEAVLGGLADYADSPAQFAIDAGNGQLQKVLAPIASNTVTTIVGFTEITKSGRLYNSAAVFQRGVVTGLYRKLHPALRKSKYHAGSRIPVFQVGDLTFGVLLCNDSNFPELARTMVEKGAAVLFVPSNNGLPPGKADVVNETREVDMTLALKNQVAVIRADVAGRASGLVSYGSSAIVDSNGLVVQSARRLAEDLLVVELAAACHG